MSRHSVQCRDSGTRHFVAATLCALDRDALSRQCGVVWCHDREGHARATEQARCARLQRTRSGAHDKVGAPKLSAQDRGILSRQRFLCRDRLLTVVKKKNQGPHGIGPSQNNIRA